MDVQFHKIMNFENYVNCFYLFSCTGLLFLTYSHYCLQNIETKIKKEVDEATVAAKKDSEITMDELASDVSADFLEGSIRNVTPWNRVQHKRVGPAVNYK